MDTWSEMTLILGAPTCHHVTLCYTESLWGQGNKRNLGDKIGVDIVFRNWSNPQTGFLICGIRVILIVKAECKPLKFPYTSPTPFKIIDQQNYILG